MDESGQLWQTAARRLLRRIRRPGALEFERSGVTLRDATASGTVRDALLTCIERALTHEDPRLATVVRRCDIDGDPAKSVALDLHVSPRQFARYRASAIEAIGAEMRRVAEAAADVPRDPRRAEARRALESAEFLVTRKAVGDNALAIRAARRALRLDPMLADAWLVIATAQLAFALWHRVDGAVPYARAHAALDRAQALAPRSGAARGLRAAVTWWSTHDAARARALAEDALGTDAGTPRGHYTLGWMSGLDGDFDAAERHFALAARTEPYVGVYHISEAVITHLRGDSARCAEMCARLLELEPECSSVRSTYGEVLTGLGRFDEAAAMLAATPPEAMSSSVLTALAVARAHAGDVDGARAIGAKMRASLVEHAAVALSIGDEDAAWRALERAPAQHNAMLEMVPHDPVFASIAGEPRFQKILRESRKACA